MTPAKLAELHRRCFTKTRPWNEDEFASLLASKFVFLVSMEHGFALGRSIAGETELLTIAIDPNARKRGFGMRLLHQFETKCVQNGCSIVVLEVAEDNHAAIRLYQKSGYRESARRPAYYQMLNGEKIDAILMQKVLE